MAQKWKPRVDVTDPKNARIVKLAKEIRNEVKRRHGAELTYEQSRDAAVEVVTEALWVDAHDELQEMVTDDDEVDIEGKRYRRLEQGSSAVYYGRWGSHEITEALYREVGVRNGPTVKPIERRAGVIARRMTPDLARIVGELGADVNSRELERMMRVVGMRPPSRSFLEKRLQQMAGQIAESVEDLEQHARMVEQLPEEIASISCGMDRMAVRMSEPHRDPANAPEPRRTEPYQRTPPPPKEHNYRMAWVATATSYNKAGEPLHTWRYGAEADADPKSLAQRVTADVARLVLERPSLPVNCVQDAASELLILPKTLRTALPANANIHELVDFEHLMGYLDKVVDACEPEGDPHDWKGWYRHQLLQDDAAIDRIWRKLRRLGKTLPNSATAERKAVATALSYIRKRKGKMRYASLYAANLAIGSGATEGSCALMQQRVKRRGQSWEPPGLRGILAIRGLVLSDRWGAAWQSYAAKHRSEVRSAA
jgi:hypothetical protein